MIKSKTFRAWLPGQSDLMPASPIEWLPSDSMMSFLLDLAVRVLTGNQQPDHSRISEFRRRNLDALSSLFVQILRLCQKVGMVSLGHVALDGTKVEANASKHKPMSHERML